MAHHSADRPVPVPPGPTLVRADAAPHESGGPEFPVDLPVRPRTQTLRAARAAKGKRPAEREVSPDAAQPSARASRHDVLVLALAARARFADASAEAQRKAILGEVHAAALDLARRLRDHTNHCIVEYRGSHGAWDVVAEAQGTYEAHDRYARVARHAAAQLRPLVPVPAELE